MINDQQLNKKEELINEQKHLIQLIDGEKEKDDITKNICSIAKEAIKAEKLTKVNECFDKLMDFCFANSDDNNRKEIIQKTFEVLKRKKALLACEMSPKSSFSSLDDTKEGAIKIVRENLERAGLNNNGLGIWPRVINYFLGQNGYEKVIKEYEKTIRNCTDSANIEEIKSETVSIIELIEAKQHQGRVEVFLKDVVKNRNFYGQEWKYPLTEEEGEKFFGKRKISEIKKLWKEFTEKQLRQEILRNIQSSEQFNSYIESKAGSPEEKAVVLKVLKREKEGILKKTKETTKKIRSRIIELEWEITKEKKESLSVAEQVSSVIYTIENNLDDLITHSELKCQLVIEGHLDEVQTWQDYLKNVTTLNDLTTCQSHLLTAIAVVSKRKLQENEGKIGQLQEELNAIRESEKQFGNSFQIQDSDNLWQEGVKSKLGISQAEDLPSDWLDQLVEKSELDNAQKDLQKASDTTREILTGLQDKIKLLEDNKHTLSAKFDKKVEENTKKEAEIVDLQRNLGEVKENIEDWKLAHKWVIQDGKELVNRLNDKENQITDLSNEKDEVINERNRRPNVSVDDYNDLIEHLDLSHDDIWELRERYETRKKMVLYSGSMIGSFLVIVGSLVIWKLRK